MRHCRSAFYSTLASLGLGVVLAVAYWTLHKGTDDRVVTTPPATATSSVRWSWPERLWCPVANRRVTCTDLDHARWKSYDLLDVHQPPLAGAPFYVGEPASSFEAESIVCEHRGSSTYCQRLPTGRSFRNEIAVYYRRR